MMEEIRKGGSNELEGEQEVENLKEMASVLVLRYFTFRRTWFTGLPKKVSGGLVR